MTVQVREALNTWRDSIAVLHDAFRQMQQADARFSDVEALLIPVRRLEQMTQAMTTYGAELVNTQQEKA